MIIHSRFALSLLVPACLTLFGSGLGLAQTSPSGGADVFPTKRVTIFVGFTPGGTTDITARVIGEKLQAKWGQPVIIENRPGGGSNIAPAIVAKAPPDGYTLALGVTGSHGINISLYKNLPFHPLRDFEPITQGTLHPNAIFVHPNFPANTLQELLAMARRDPEKLVFGHDGTGSGAHLTMELLLYKAGAKMQNVPYKGAAVMLTDLIGERLPVAITGMPGVISMYRAKKVKVLGVTALTRSPAVPELPTAAEQGFPGFSGEPWSGFFAPKGTPKPIIDKIATDIIAASRLPDVEKKFADQGTRFVGSRPEEFRAFVAAEIDKWAEAVRVSGATPD